MMDVESWLRSVVLASVWVLVGLFLVIAAVDLVLAIVEAPSVGSRLRRWARHYPGFAVALVFVYGALLGHFFSQP